MGGDADSRRISGPSTKYGAAAAVVVHTAYLALTRHWMKLELC